MPKQRRRRRFFALEGRFEVDDTGELQGVVDPSLLTSAAALETEAEETAGASDADPVLPDIRDAPTPESDDSLAPAFRLDRVSRSRSGETRRFSAAQIFIWLGCLAVGMLLGYLSAKSLPRFDTPVALTAGHAQPDTGPLTPADQDDLDAAYAARHGQQFAAAERLFDALGRRHPGWGAVEVERGRTLLYAGRIDEAGAVLVAAADKGWKPAEANFLLGTLQNARRSYADAELRFARAVEIDPTEPQSYFFWGECLRGQGKLRAAAAKFRSALLRNEYETATGLYRAKLWLCEVEAGDENQDGIGANIDAALRLPHVPMEAYFAQAARDLTAGDFQAAAIHLSRARRRSDPTVFRYILSDPLFSQVRARPEFAGFFQALPSAARRPTDTATGSPDASLTRSAPAATVTAPVPAANTNKP